MTEKGRSPYEDIINLPHPAPARRPRMAAAGRAAQFSPFAALTGYEAQVKEAARLTDRKIELTEEEKGVLDAKLRRLTAAGGEAVFTWFLPDSRKEGGAYTAEAGTVRRVDGLARTVTLDSGTVIPLEDLRDIEPAEE